jgi:hypothetical protein
VDAGEIREKLAEILGSDLRNAKAVPDLVHERAGSPSSSSWG